MTVRDDSDFDGARFLLGGKKEQPAAMAASKKKAAEPPVQWDQKHAKKVNLKGLKLPKKPAKPQPQHDTTPVQWAMTPTPMAPAAMEVTSVPAPKAMWAGLGLMSVLAACRVWASRGGLPN